MTGPGGAAAGRRGLERLRGARVAVWGTGVEGTGAIALARSVGAEVTVVGDPRVAGDSRVAGDCGVAGDSRVAGASGVAGDSRVAGGPVLAPSVLADGRFDVVVRSPGVSRYRPELLAASGAGAVVTTLTAIWLEDFGDGPVIAVTGSKGKTTTATLAAAALRAAGRRVAVAGNMGRPVAELYGIAPPGAGAHGAGPAGTGADAVVIEVSSFQAAEVTVSPRVGVLTLLAPDHLDWHGTYERYVADKLNLFAHRPGSVVAVNATDPPAWAAAGRFAGRTPYGRPGDPIGVGEGPGGDLQVTVAGRPYLAAGELEGTAFGLRGRHNLVNLCGALAATQALGGDVPEPASLLGTLDATPALGSRLRTVAAAGGLELVDDALASNPAGVVAALETFAGRRLCLIAGGADRGVPMAPLVDALASLRPEPSVVVLGPAGRRLAGELAARCPGLACRAAESVEEAVHVAADALGGPGVVLFSPGAPTPREDGSYVDRSAAFAAAARACLGPGAGPGGGRGAADPGVRPC